MGYYRHVCDWLKSPQHSSRDSKRALYVLLLFIRESIVNPIVRKCCMNMRFSSLILGLVLTPSAI